MAMKNKNFAAFILTHGRPHHILTLSVLERLGYTGKWYLVVDDEDETQDIYKELYGDNVVVFSKADIASRVDTIDNRQDHGGVVYARNAIFDISESLGHEYFIMLDDDYWSFRYIFDLNRLWKYSPVRNLDKIFDAVLGFYKSIPATSIAFTQSGEHIGGGGGGLGKAIKTKRKVMNTFFCSTKRRFTFSGRTNEDVNAYIMYGAKGHVFLTVNNIRIAQLLTQSNPGGLTDIYLNDGTYVKSMYSVICCPSFVTVSPMGPVHPRLHHRIHWNNAVPKILSEEHA